MTSKNKNAELPRDVSSLPIQVLGQDDASLRVAIASGAAAVNTGALSTTRDMIVRVHSTQDIYFEFGTTVTANITTSPILKADTTEYFNIKAGQYLSVLQVSAAGDVRITELM